MKSLLPFDLPMPLQKGCFQRLLLAMALLLMAILLFVTTREPESLIGIFGTVYFLISAFTLARLWHNGKIICVAGHCISVENVIGNMVQAVFSVEDTEESALTLSVPKKGAKVVPSLEYNLYLSSENHNMLYGLEIRTIPSDQ